MKYIKKFSESISVKDISIEDFLESFDVIDYEIVDDLINVNGDVHLSSSNLEKVPFNFGVVTGFFNLYNNRITSLNGCPKKVGNAFSCSSNQLKSLEGCPEKAKSFFCSDNKLTSLNNSPKEIPLDFFVDNNRLISLEGCPKKISGHFYCENNELTSLESGPEEVGGIFNCQNNPIYEVYKLFGTYVRYKASLDYSYWKGLNIKRGRFELACKDAGIDVPETIEGYNYI